MIRIISSSMIALAIVGWAWSAEAQTASGAGGGGAQAGTTTTAGAQGGVATPGMQAMPNNPGATVPPSNPGVAAPNPNVPNGANARAAANASAAAAAGGAAPAGGANVNAFGQAQFGAGMNSRANPTGAATTDRMRTSTQAVTPNQAMPSAPVVQNVFPVFPNLNPPTPLIQNPALANGAGQPGTVNIPTGQTAAPVPSDQVVAGTNVNTYNPSSPIASTLNPNGVASQTPGQGSATAANVASSSVPVNNGVPIVNNQWRYVNQGGQWWYWTPNNSWMYYNGGSWYRY
jgi:hypothetical protein